MERFGPDGSSTQRNNNRTIHSFGRARQCLSLTLCVAWRRPSVARPRLPSRPPPLPPRCNDTICGACVVSMLCSGVYTGPGKRVQKRFTFKRIVSHEYIDIVHTRADTFTLRASRGRDTGHTGRDTDGRRCRSQTRVERRADWAEVGC